MLHSEERKKCELQNLLYGVKIGFRERTMTARRGN
jgi:hypothetical protein